jgi:GNAT superfamily N-acetyltransferase
MQIRASTSRDASEIARLAGQLGYSVDAEDARPFLRAIQRDRDQVVFVATGEDHSLLGWVHVFKTHRAFTHPFAEIGGLVVDENHRRALVGSRLLKASEQWAGRAGCSAMLIRSNVTRIQAHDFYHRAGYRLTKEQKVFRKDL